LKNRGESENPKNEIYKAKSQSHLADFTWAKFYPKFIENENDFSSMQSYLYVS
jgi:hypothetical protein